MSPDPKAVPAWRRESAGRYRSFDDRFSLEGEGSGRWFVVDAEVRDELGLGRTTGPFATLDAAKDEAVRLRDEAPAESPLRERIAAAAARPAASEREVPKPRRSAPSLEPPKSRRRSWLELLEERDGEAATRARKLIAGLERLGVADADDLVRRDGEANVPVVASRLLAVALADALAGSGVEASAAAAVLDALLGTIAGTERLAGADRALPGWALVERRADDPERRRRIRLTAREVTRES